MNFSLHYCIKYFKSSNYFPSILNFFFFFFSVDAYFSERFPDEACVTFHSNAGRYKEEFESNVHFLGNTGHA